MKTHSNQDPTSRTEPTEAATATLSGLRVAVTGGTSGLGLALSKSLMEMQGGILALASQPGKGTVACAAFPRRKDANVRLPQFMRAEAHVLTGAEPTAAPPYKITQAAE